jgi:hypothetical protein
MNTIGIAIAVAIAALVMTAKKTPKTQKVHVPIENAAIKAKPNKSKE